LTKLSVHPTQPAWKQRSGIHAQRVLDPLRLRLLLEVEARGSISAAAEACMIGQPSASMHLRNLELAVGHRLIERDARGSRLTPAGRIVAAHAARVLGALDGMTEELRAYQGGTQGTLAVAACSAASYLLPQALRAFGESHPKVDVAVWVVDSATVRSLVDVHEVALGITGDISPAGGVEPEWRLDDEIVGIAAPGALAIVDGELPAAELAHQTLLVLHPGSSQRAAATKALRSRPEAAPARTWLIDSLEALKRAVRDQVGVAFVSQLAVREELRRGELVRFRLRELPAIAHPLYVTWPVERRSRSAAAVAESTAAVPHLAQRAFSSALRIAWRALQPVPVPMTAEDVAVSVSAERGETPW
jgi:LysR family transcriptional regulator, low CO2-responsive transcriptional regulator